MRLNESATRCRGNIVRGDAVGGWRDARMTEIYYPLSGFVMDTYAPPEVCPRLVQTRRPVS